MTTGPPVRGIPNLESFAAMCEPPPSQQAVLNALWESQPANQLSAAELWEDADKQQDYLQEQQAPVLLEETAQEIIQEGGSNAVSEMGERQLPGQGHPERLEDYGMQFLSEPQSENDPSHVSGTPSQAHCVEATFPGGEGSQTEPLTAAALSPALQTQAPLASCPASSPEPQTATAKALSPGLQTQAAAPSFCPSPASAQNMSEALLAVSPPRLGPRCVCNEASTPESLGNHKRKAAGDASCSMLPSQQPFTQSPWMLAGGSSTPSLPQAKTLSLSPVCEGPSSSLPGKSPGGAQVQSNEFESPGIGGPSGSADVAEGRVASQGGDAIGSQSPGGGGNVPFVGVDAQMGQDPGEGQPIDGVSQAGNLQRDVELPANAAAAQQSEVQIAQEASVSLASSPGARQAMQQSSSSGSSDKFEIQLPTPSSENATCEGATGLSSLTGLSSRRLTAPTDVSTDATEDNQPEEQPALKIRRKRLHAERPGRESNSIKGELPPPQGKSLHLGTEGGTTARHAVEMEGVEAAQQSGKSLHGCQGLHRECTAPGGTSTPPYAQPALSEAAVASLTENVHCGADLVLWWFGLI
mmetsp:Transcript_15245/g.42660  ORF Transcript_15245/g.42660 Transcript_15245/m.42660 type:complete len:582 (+) Transcript_15245:386-2131(+)|eukprot:CAMPEP_0117685350 /NCGR_PEP_ID=MMETSP0804-20121206/21683_1 /TAXON_ID=1074897 /ORGANISM="Tetraselmis astigmatica, Strain CCMP880" /LENGTH=581 /DNA_ID=CAMNT_0005496597 /DNA_START=318 /DNA_END=2063 /DNA_ORIENTATION=-